MHYSSDESSAEPLSVLRRSLAEEFPDLTAATIALAIDRATRAATGRNGNPALVPARTAVLARDRLDAQRARAAAAARTR